MRVLHIVYDLSPGGAERLVWELCRRRAPGIEVEVATIGGGGPLEPRFRAEGVSLLLGGPRRREILPRLLPAVRRADVVHTHLFAGDAWGRVAALLAGHRAVVTTEHNVNRDETWHRHAKRLLAPVSRRVVAVSEAVARHSRAVERIGAPVVVIPNGVDTERFTPGPPGERGGAGLLAVGRRVPQKGFDVLLDALPDGARLRIAGEGPFHREAPGVEWLGLVEDPRPLYRAADVLVAPSRWEGFGLAVAEGMACGLPVVASAVDGLVEVVGDAGVLVPPEDPSALRAALTALLADPARRAALGARARERVVARFELGRMVRAYEALYAEVLEESRTAAARSTAS